MTLKAYRKLSTSEKVDFINDSSGEMFYNFMPNPCLLYYWKYEVNLAGALAKSLPRILDSLIFNKNRPEDVHRIEHYYNFFEWDKRMGSDKIVNYIKAKLQKTY
jgi:hypothetical protein